MAKSEFEVGASHRHQARAEVVGEIVAWLKQRNEFRAACWYGAEIEAKFGGRDASA